MKIEVSNGDLVDRAVILRVKLDRISDPDKLANITAEFDELMKSVGTLGINENSSVFRALYELHQENWDLIETWNRKDRDGIYDEEYIAVTKKSNDCNRRRFYLKSLLNRDSRLVEEKSDIYGDYKTNSAHHGDSAT